MLIGIDGNEANIDKKVGISEYVFELLKQFEQFRIQNLEFRIYLKDKPREDLPKEREGWKYRVVNPRKFWTQIGLPIDLYLHGPRPDIFFTPTHYAPRFSPIPTIVSIMDLSYIYFPEMFKKSDLYQLRNWSSYSIKNAKRIFTISKASKNDIIKIYQMPEDKVIVTYPGIRKELSIKNKELSMDKLKKKYGIDGEYILFVGTLQPRKNIARLIKAFSILCHLFESEPQSQRRERNEGSLGSSSVKNDISLIIVGKKGWLYDEILEAPKKFNVEDKVKFLEFVPDEELPELYRNALCFVLPSLYEGFGLPVLEAMQNGCPVITSNISSLPEAGGEAALYVDPEDVNDIASKIKSLIENKKLREDLIKKGYNQVKKFSWEKTAKETLTTLEKLVKNDQ